MRRKKIAAGVAALCCCCALGASRDRSSVPDPRSAIAAFADDDVRWNATRMLWRLRTAIHRADDAWLAALYPALEFALDSEDWQQRQFAAAALRSIPDYVPSRRMLEVVVEGLRNDALPSGDGAWSPVMNATGGVTYLLQHVGLAADALVDGLHSSDAQQRFLCAYVLGMTSQARGLPLAAEILLDHLRDNNIGGDAVWATAALYRFGPRVIPLLDRVRPVDDQQRKAIALIVLDLVDPPMTTNEIEARRNIVELTSVYRDPAHQYKHGRVRLIWRR